MVPPWLSVVVPSWNGMAHLPRLLRALARQSRGGFEIVVVDNGSSDGSREWLAARPEVRLVALERNLGFPAAMNRGIAAAAAPLLLMLNQDMEPEPDFVAALAAAAAAHPEAGSFACRVVRADDPARIDSAGDRIEASGRARGIGRGEPDGPAFAAGRWVFAGTAGAWLMRREAFADAGGFDEAFFLYVEDTDLAFRAQLRGWRCRYVPGAVTRHAGSASLAGREDLRSRLCLRNHLLFLFKNYPLALVPRHLGAVMGGIGREVAFAFAATRAARGALAAAALVSGALVGAAARVPRALVRRARFRRRIPLAAVEALFE